MSELFADLDTLYTDGAEDQVNARHAVYGFQKLFGRGRNTFTYVIKRHFRGGVPKPVKNIEYRDGSHDDNHNFALLIASMREDLVSMEHALIQKKRLKCDGWLSAVERLDSGPVKYKKNYRDRAKYGWTAVHYAASAAKNEACKMLGKHGWNCHLLDYRKRTPKEVVPSDRELAKYVVKTLRSFREKKRWRTKRVTLKPKKELKVSCPFRAPHPRPVSLLTQGFFIMRACERLIYIIMYSITKATRNSANGLQSLKSSGQTIERLCSGVNI